MTIFVVTPPRRGGVYDYADTIVRSLDGKGKLLEWSRSSCSPCEEAPCSHDELFIQYSGYGYAKRGAPLWLLKKLRRMREQGIIVGVFFHELFAFGPPWSSAFWLSPVQREIAVRLSGLADFWITNRALSAEWLQKHRKSRLSAVLPISSTIGEASVYTENRSRKIVVFGGPGLRAAAYSTSNGRLFTFAKKYGLTIHDVGPPSDNWQMNSELAAHGVITHGMLPPADVCNLLADAMFGVISYPVEFIGKSSVLAAYCAHGICPIVLSSDYNSHEGLASGVHYLPGFETITGDLQHALVVGKAAWDWYQPHNIYAHRSVLQEMIERARAAI